jgi:hypothetical protein
MSIKRSKFVFVVVDTLHLRRLALEVAARRALPGRRAAIVINSPERSSRSALLNWRGV